MKILKRLVLTGFLAAAALGLSACYKHYTITVGLSRALKDYYGIYPSIEVDIFAAAASKADEVKTAGVEKYFAPGSSLRSGLKPHTIRFSEEITAPVSLSYRDMPWKEWKRDKPEKLILVVNLPLNPDEPGDKLIAAVDIQQRLVQWDHAYFEISPNQIAQVYTKPVDPRAGGTQ